MSLKTESMVFKTQKSLQELTELLRQAANQTKARVENVRNDDPLGMYDEQPVLSVVLSRRLGTFLNLKYFAGSPDLVWAVQVYVYEMNTEREVRLVALGSTLGETILSQGRGFHLRASRDHMEILSGILR